MASPRRTEQGATPAIRKKVRKKNRAMKAQRAADRKKTEKEGGGMAAGLRNSAQGRLGAAVAQTISGFFRDTSKNFANMRPAAGSNFASSRNNIHNVGRRNSSKKQ